MDLQTAIIKALESEAASQREMAGEQLRSGTERTIHDLIADSLGNVAAELLDGGS